jgi:hypothetical protein
VLNLYSDVQAERSKFVIVVPVNNNCCYSLLLLRVIIGRVRFGDIYLDLTRSTGSRTGAGNGHLTDGAAVTVGRRRRGLGVVATLLLRTRHVFRHVDEEDDVSNRQIRKIMRRSIERRFLCREIADKIFWTKIWIEAPTNQNAL